MALMKINIKCCWQQPIERTGAKTARSHYATSNCPLLWAIASVVYAFLSLSVLTRRRTAVSEDAPTDFNAIQQLCTRCQARQGQARPANVLLVPPKLAPATSLVSTIFGHCPGPRIEPHGTARRCILMMPASACLFLPYLSLLYPSLSLLHPRCAPLALSVSVSVGRAMAAPLLSLTKVISVLPSPIVTNWHKCPAAGTESPINASYLQGFAQKWQWYCLKVQALTGYIIKMFLQVTIKLELH